MQKLSPKQLALALHEAVATAPASEASELVKLFVALLVKKRMIRKSDEIIEAYRKLDLTAHGITEAHVSSAQPLTKEAKEKIIEYIQEEYGTKKVVLDKKIDESLIGGMKLRIGDEVTDGTLKGRLSKLERALTN